MANLFPSEYPEDISAEIEANIKNSVVGYKQSVSYDLVTKQVVRDGKNKVLTATGKEAWEQWVYNCLNTERYSCAAYPTDFGIEKEKALKATTRAEKEAILTSEITDALLADPYKRTKYVSEITFNWVTPDSAEISLIIVGADDAEIDITITLT